jgi:hypothetical protein
VLILKENTLFSWSDTAAVADQRWLLGQTSSPGTVAIAIGDGENIPPVFFAVWFMASVCVLSLPALSVERVGLLWLYLKPDHCSAC